MTEAPHEIRIGPLEPIATVIADDVRHVNKSNVRFRGRGRSSQWSELKRYEEAIRVAALYSYQKKPTLDPDLVMVVSIEIGALVQKNGRVMSAETRAKRIDADGTKGILDALEGVIYRRDSQIRTVLSRISANATGRLGDRVVIQVFARRGKA